jgi:hypothetical protein
MSTTGDAERVQATAASALPNGHERRTPESEPPTWEAAYEELKSTVGNSTAEPGDVDRRPLAGRSTETLAEPATESSAGESRAMESRAMESQNIEAQTLAAPSDSGDSSVELPRAPKAFDCRSLAAALRRLRPNGGRIVLVSVGPNHSTGMPEWSAELADELRDVAARPVDRFAAGALAIDGSDANRPACDGFRLYFVGAEFAAARGPLLRSADCVLLVVQEGATPPKAAEVVRGALAAQQVEFAGFVYVAQ